MRFYLTPWGNPVFAQIVLKTFQLKLGRTQRFAETAIAASAVSSILDDRHAFEETFILTLRRWKD